LRLPDWTMSCQGGWRTFFWKVVHDDPTKPSNQSCIGSEMSWINQQDQKRREVWSSQQQGPHDWLLSSVGKKSSFWDEMDVSSDKPMH
jgi:hypothetical protein